MLECHAEIADNCSLCTSLFDVNLIVSSSFHRDVMFGPITASDPLQTSERDKNISLLLTELESLRETNKKVHIYTHIFNHKSHYQ